MKKGKDNKVKIKAKEPSLLEKRLAEETDNISGRKRRMLKSVKIVNSILNNKTNEDDVDAVRANFEHKVFQGRHPKDLRMAKDVALDGRGKAALDSFLKMSGNRDYNIPLDIMRTFQQTFIGWDACAILAQNVWINRAITQPVEDGLAPGFYLTNSDLDENDALSETELRELAKRANRKYNLMVALKKAAIKTRMFGWAFVIPIFKKGREPDMTVPYNREAIAKGSFEGFQVIEPRWIRPRWGLSDSLNPTSMAFFEPQEYVLPSGGKIHASWLRKLIHVEVGDIMKMVYFGGGISIPQMIYERVYAAERVADEAPLIASTKRTIVADANLNNYLANPNEVEDRLAALSYLRDNFGVFVKENGTEVKQIDTSLAGFDEIINSQYYLIAAIAKIPVSKFLKTPIKGMNATGAAEQADYNQLLRVDQEEKYCPLIDWFMEMLTTSDGKYHSLSSSFYDLDIPTARTQSDINVALYNGVNQLVVSNVISREEARERIRTAPDSGFAWLSKELPPKLEVQVENQIKSQELRDSQGRFAPSGKGEIKAQKKNEKTEEKGVDKFKKDLDK